ncbi:MAG TPA: glycoside hydrolase domain-containing protein [archaeon]|nr:glycoside hydrolase domain-containing protein [archaeon]
MKPIFLINFVLFLALSSALAQRGDLPVPADYEKSLLELGAVEKFLPVQDDTLIPADTDLSRGWLLYHRDRNFEVLPNSKPAPGEALEKLIMTATPGEIESEPFSAYALRDVGKLSASPKVQGAEGENAWLYGAAAIEDVLFHPVQYQLKTPHTWPTLSYLRYPVFIRPAAGYPVPSGTSRLFWVTVTVPPEAGPGTYRASIRLTDDRGASADFPLEVRVLPFKLTTENLPRFGAFLSGEPFAKGEWRFMKRYGMDALQWFWDSHGIKIRNEGGRIAMDFSEYDSFVQGMKEAGMRGPLVLSLGNAWLGHYEMKLAEVFGLRLLNRVYEGKMVTIADFTDPRWEELWVEGLRIIFGHAKKAGWPELALLIHDEPTKHIMAYYPYKYHLVKQHFPEIPVYGVFFQPEKDPGPLLKSCDIMVANRDLQYIKMLAKNHGKRFWTYNNICADQSFGKCRFLYGQIPSYYGSEVMWFWCWNYWINNSWNDFDGRGETVGGPAQSDADWVAVYPSVDGVEPVRTLAIEAAREGIDDVRYIKTLENLVKGRDPGRWESLEREIRSRQAGMFNGIFQDNRTYSDRDFFITTRNDDIERLREFVIREILKTLEK